MKKLATVAILFVVVVFAAGAAFGQAHENTGCGLGTILFQDKSNDSTLLQAFQATTNASFGSQTFGITSGTSDCKMPSKFVSNERLNEFVVANMDNLAKDIARGGGETLEAYADLLQVPAAQRPAFYQKLQSGFANIFTSDQVVLADVVDNTIAVSSR